MRPIAWSLPLLILAPAVAGCLGGDEGGADVVATFYPLAYLAERIGGGNVSVATLVKPGVEPHDHEPTTSDLRKLRDARLLVVQGGGFEPWLATAEAQAPGARLVVATQGITLVPGEAHEGEEEEEALDPHVWLDPVLFAAMATNVEEGLVAAFPEHASAFRARAAALRADLDALHEAFENGLRACETRFIITNHEAYGYMAARYGFVQEGISGLAPEAEPDARTLARLAKLARDHNVSIVFFEELASPRVAKVLADEVGATTRVLSPIESIDPDAAAGGADYASRMRENLEGLQAAMRCA